MNVGTWTNTGLIGGTSGTVTLSGTNWTNEGTVDMTGALVINPTTWQNAGSIISRNGSLSLSGNWSNPNTSSITLLNSNLTLGGNFTRADLDSLSKTGGTTTLAGTLEQHGPRARSERQFQLVGLPWQAAGVAGGTIGTTNPALAVNFDGNDANRLTDVTSNANLSLPTGTRLHVTGDLTLNATATLGQSANLLFDTDSTLGGTGKLALDYPSTGVGRTSGLPEARR